MSHIGINHDEVEQMRRAVEARLEDAYESFGKIEPCDGGIASNMIGLIASAAVEAAQQAADSYLAVMVLSTETSNDLRATDVAATQTYKGFLDEWPDS